MPTNGGYQFQDTPHKNASKHTNHTHTHAPHTRRHTRAHARRHTRAHARWHTRAHARTNTRTHTHTHTHTWMCWRRIFRPEDCRCWSCSLTWSPSFFRTRPTPAFSPSSSPLGCPLHDSVIGSLFFERTSDENRNSENHICASCTVITVVLSLRILLLRQQKKSLLRVTCFEHCKRVRLCSDLFFQPASTGTERTLNGVPGTGSRHVAGEGRVGTTPFRRLPLHLVDAVLSFL